MAEELGITVKKNKDFSDWYSQVIQKAELADYTSVSGCIVFKPNAYHIWEKIIMVVDEELKKTGVKNTYFPLFIPEKLLKMEEAHVKGFTPEVAWVTEAGNSELKERLAVRPTSETIMYESYSKWIRSWRDLPLRYNQWNNVVRWEFHHPIPFLRTREFLWNEGHSAFATKKEAEKEVKDILNMYKKILKDYLALPGLLGRKTDSEKFAGAEYTDTIELILPNGKAIQGPDSHHLGQNFAKVFNIKFIDKDEKEKFVWQNSWAITTRMIGVTIAIHSDDKGLVLPPKLAPVQIVIVPIIIGKDKKTILKECKRIKDMLNGYSVFLDDRAYNPGWKFNEWELKGVPLRIEIGPNDIKKKQVIAVRRDNGLKIALKVRDLNKKIPLVLEGMHNNLYNKARKFFEESIIKVKRWEDFVKAIEDKKIVLAPWCKEGKCIETIKAKLGVKSLNIPFEQPKTIKDKCVYCNKKAKVLCRFGKSY